MQKKRILLPLFMAALVIVSSLSFLVPASAAVTAVKVRHGDVEIMGGRSRLIDSVTYVPLRAFADSMGGCSVGWNGDTKTASVSAGGLYLNAKVGGLYITANDRCFYTVGEIKNIDGLVYVPIRPMARAFGLDLAWDGASYSVNLTGSGRAYCKSGSSFYNSDDLYWLSRIISAESATESMLGKMAVGNVIMNRVASRDYPNTIYNVIFDTKYGTQFTPAATGTVYRTPSADSVVAAKICLEGYSLSTEMIFFLNPKIATNQWITKSCTYVMTIGNHVFYK